MTARRPSSAALGPLKDYARAFDELFGVLAQRAGFRAYLQGLLLPRDRNKTLTGLVGTEPVVGAQAAPAQRLQFFLSESSWDAGAVNQRRLDVLWAVEALRPHPQGVLIVDDSGDRKAGRHTAHVGRQYLGSIGKIDNGIVAVTTVWADERVYYPLHFAPYTPASRLPKGTADPAFRTKPQLAAALIDQARGATVPFRAIVADCFYGDHLGFGEALETARLPYVLALKPNKGTWAPAEDAHTPQEAARELPWESSEAPGDWTPVRRRFRDGHEETWWGAEVTLGGRGPDQRQRLVVATTDPATLPSLSTWYLLTNLPRPGSPHTDTAPGAPATVDELVHLYGLRGWVEQSYKQVTSKSKDTWAGQTFRCGVIRRSSGTGSSSAAPSPSAGGPGSARPQRHAPRSGPWLPAIQRRPPPLALLHQMQRGGGKIGAGEGGGEPAPSRPVSWPVTLRRVQGWLTPWVLLCRWWQAWSTRPPPAELRALLDVVGQGRPLYLYLRC